MSSLSVKGNRASPSPLVEVEAEARAMELSGTNCDALEVAGAQPDAENPEGPTGDGSAIGAVEGEGGSPPVDGGRLARGSSLHGSRG